MQFVLRRGEDEATFLRLLKALLAFRNRYHAGFGDGQAAAPIDSLQPNAGKYC